MPTQWPTELLDHILEYISLNVRTLPTLVLVSKQFHSLLSEKIRYETIWKQKYPHYPVTSNFNRVASKIREYKKSRNQLNISRDYIRTFLLGAESVGKSTLQVMYNTGYFIDNYDPTIEDAYRKMVQVRGKHLIIEVIDPMADYYNFVEKMVLNVPSYLLVFSLNDYKSLNELHKKIEWVERIIEMPIYYKPILLVGTKSDLECNITQEEIDHFMAEHRIQSYIPTSAKKNENVTEAFEQISELLCDHDTKIDAELLAKWEKEKPKKCLVM